MIIHHQYHVHTQTSSTHIHTVVWTNVPKTQLSKFKSTLLTNIFLHYAVYTKSIDYVPMV